MVGCPLTEEVAENGRWHTGQGWRDIGYRWIIDHEGTVCPAEPRPRSAGT